MSEEKNSVPAGEIHKMIVTTMMQVAASTIDVIENNIQRSSVVHAYKQLPRSCVEEVLTELLPPQKTPEQKEALVVYVQDTLTVFNKIAIVQNGIGELIHNYIVQNEELIKSLIEVCTNSADKNVIAGLEQHKIEKQKKQEPVAGDEKYFIPGNEVVH